MLLSGARKRLKRVNSMDNYDKVVKFIFLLFESSTRVRHILVQMELPPYNYYSDFFSLSLIRRVDAYIFICICQGGGALSHSVACVGYSERVRK